MAEGFFDNNASPAFAALIKPYDTQVMNNLRVLTGWSRKIKDAIARSTAFLIEGIKQRAKFLIAFHIVKVGLQVMDARCKGFPNLWIDWFLARILIDGFECLFAELIVAVGTTRESYDGES